MRILLVTLLIFQFGLSHAQDNCQAYLYMGDTLKFEACQVAEQRDGYYQFSKAYQEALDDALAIDSTYAIAYRNKSTAYLKSGDFITWKQLMDKAVKYDPEGQLYYRGWCRYQFFRDYKGAIADIERLDELVDYDIGYSENGDYHLHIARALRYKAIGEKEKAIEIIRTQLNDPSYSAGMYDYLHLGVLYLELDKYEAAILAFDIQKELNDLAENRYYAALAYKQLGKLNDYRINLEKAKSNYLNGMKMFDPYVEPMDKVYLETIEKELAR